MSNERFTPPEFIHDPLSREYQFVGTTHRPDDPDHKFYLYTHPDPLIHDRYLREYEVKELMELQQGKQA